MKRWSSFQAGSRVIVGFALAAMLLAPISGAAEGWGYDLGSELMSPYCPGRTLSSCPSPQAAELVQWIVTQEAAGATKEQVIEMLIERFGEEILGAPPAEGITLWAYIFPVAGFIGFGIVAFFVLRKMVGQGAHAEPTGREPSLGESAPGASSTGAGAAPEAPGSSGPPAADDDFARMVDAEIARRR